MNNATNCRSAMGYVPEVEIPQYFRSFEQEHGSTRATDTTSFGGVDTLRTLLINDTDPAYTQLRTELALVDRDWSEALTELDGDGALLNGRSSYYKLLLALQAHNGDPGQLTAGEIAELTSVMHAGEAGAALVARTLWEADATTYVPEVEIPQHLRSAGDDHRDGGAGSVRPALAAYPNPANSTAYVTWPPSADGAWLLVFDAAGREVARLQLVGNGLSELKLDELPLGLYKLAVAGTDLSTTLSVLR